MNDAAWCARAMPATMSATSAAPAARCTWPESAVSAAENCSTSVAPAARAPAAASARGRPPRRVRQDGPEQPVANRRQDAIAGDVIVARRLSRRGAARRTTAPPGAGKSRDAVHARQRPRQPADPSVALHARAPDGRPRGRPTGRGAAASRRPRRAACRPGARAARAAWRPPRRRSVEQQVRQVDLHRADVAAGAAQAAGLRQLRPVVDARAARASRPTPPGRGRRRRTRGRRSGGRPGTRSGRRRTARSTGSRRAAVPSSRLRPLSTMTTCSSSGPSGSPAGRRAGAAAAPPRSGDQVRVDGRRLARGAARQHRQHDREVRRRRHDALEAQQRHVHARQRRRQPAVALVGDDAEAAGFGDGEVDAADAHARLQELVAQRAPREGRHRRDVGHVLRRGAELLAEERARRPAGCGGRSA